MCALFISTTLIGKFLIQRRTERDVIQKKVYRSSYKVHVIILMRF